MRHKKRFAFFIFTLFSLVAVGQNLILKVKAENDKKTQFIDSLGYYSIFNDYNSLKSEADSLLQRIHKAGYIDALTKAITRTNDSLFKAELLLGDRIKKIKIIFDNNFDDTLLGLFKNETSKNYFIIDIQILENALNVINQKIAEEGDPFSTLQLVNLKKENSNLLSGQLKIITNQKRQIDGIVVKGYEKFPKSYIKHFLGIRKKATFNINDIKDRIGNLEALPFAKSIREPEVLFTNDSTTLYLYLEKTRTNNFDGFLGFGTNEDSNQLEFDGYLDLRLINNLNFGETLNLFYKSDEIDQQTFRVDAILPYMFKSPIGVELGLNIFRKDSTFQNVTQTARLNYQINAKHRVAVGISAINSTNLLETNTAVLNDYTSNFYTINYNFTEPQFYDPLFPINFFLNVSGGFGRRENDLDNISQTIFNFESYKIFNLNEKNSVFTRITGALLDSDAFLDNELFRFGGINSVRGFEENSLVADLYAVLNTEYRYRLSNSIYVHSVIDGAYFENNITETEQRLFGFGFGFGLLTQAGLFRFNYTTAQTENSPIRLSDSKIHVSLTARF